MPSLQPLQGAAAPQAQPLRAVQTRAGGFGAAALRATTQVQHRSRGACGSTGVLASPDGQYALDGAAVARGDPSRAWTEPHQPRDSSPAAKKNCLKPWRKLMWCIAALTQEYRQRMYQLLELYALPLRHDEPVVCVDEKSLQLLEQIGRASCRERV